jgi:hypothetical protein
MTEGAESVGGDWLTLGILGQWRTASSGDSLTFGRRADLYLDDNPFMHRIVGRAVYRQGTWWLQNHCATTQLELRSLASGGNYTLAAGEQLPITSTEFAVRFTAGPTTYELDGRRSGEELIIDDSGEVVGTSTLDFGTIPLSPEQHLLLVALYESSNRNNGTIEGSAVIAARLGWTPKKFHRKLDAVCLKLAREGVRGLKGDSAGLAESRRAVLLHHAVNSGLVGNGDLGLLRADRHLT